jgi:hypothetical protein
MKIEDLNFSERVISLDIMKEVNGDFGRITIIDRMTGFGWRDVETGFRDTENKFWLASGGFSILDYPELEITEAIEKIKENANTCIGV